MSGAGLDYELWCLQQSSGDHELEAIGSELAATPGAPTISLVVVAGDLDELWVGQGLDSVARQSYPRWELCAAQHGERCALDEAIAGRMQDEPRARICDTTGALGRQEALARALASARGDYVVVLDEADELARDALLRVAYEIARTGAEIVYTNEDRIDGHGHRSAPTFKSRFSPDRLLSGPYLGRLCALEAGLVREVGGLRPILGPAAEHDLLLRISERASRVAHLPEVLYHARVLTGAGRPGPASAPGAAHAAEAVVEAALQRRGEDASVSADPDSGAISVRRRPPAGALTTLIVRCDRRLARLPLPRQLERRGQPPDEVIVAGCRPDREPGPQAIEEPCPARAANLAAAEAIGDVLVFGSHSCSLPRDADQRWLAELVANATRPGVGAVSGAVVDERGRLRHGGLRVDLEGLSGPVVGSPGPEPLDDHLPLNPGGAAADLLAIEREKFEWIGGFDEEHLPGSLFVLDLAFRLEEEGLRSVFAPAVRVHCRDLRSFPGSEEADYMWSRWRERLNMLLSYERSPLDPCRSPLAPERPAVATGPAR